MKKLLIALLAVMMILPVFSVSPIAEAAGEAFTSGDFTYILLLDGTAQLTQYTGNAEALVIPAELDGHAVAAIGENAFSGCDGLTSVTIPDSVTDFGVNPFRYCFALRQIIVSPSHPSLETVDGALVNRPDGRLICYPCAFTAGMYEIPQGVRIIGDQAFAACDSLTTVTIPDSVTAVGVNPFAYCVSLRRIAVSADHPGLAVVDGALLSRTDRRLVCFPCGSAAEAYAVPQGTEVIGDFAFSGCVGLASVTLPEGVTVIGESAFSFCERLASMTLPEGVTAIGENAFLACDSLSSVTIPDGVTSIGNRAFFVCGSLTSVTVPDGVTSIGDWAFAACGGLTSVTVPDSVTAIGEDAFADCPYLTLTVGRGSFAEAYCADNALGYTFADAGR